MNQVTFKLIFQTSKIKLFALVAVYVLHVAFFDGLMARDSYASLNTTLSSCSHQSSSKNIPLEGSSYRLLIKHEQSKKAMVDVPQAFSFVSLAFSGFVEEPILPPHFDVIAHLSVNTFRLYRLFRVFLI